jgi:chromosome segregation ATPase
MSDLGDGSPADGSPGATNLLSSAIAQGVGLQEEDVELLRNFGEHALMGRVQVALEKQLRAQLLKLDNELREASEIRDSSKAAREGLGVELYGVQQQLARVQIALENSNQSVSALHDIRGKAEIELKVFQDGFATRKAAIEKEESKLEKFKGELDGINDTLRQVDKYNEEMNAEIALTKRAAAKAEVDIAAKERAKNQQDLYIDSITLEIKSLAENLSLLDAQIASQRAETQAAADTMQEAAAESEAIGSEKKSLIAQWQSSLVAMRRRDEALKSMQDSITKQLEELDSMDAEETNVHKAIRSAQDAHAMLQERFDREQRAYESLESTLETTKKQYEQLEERHTALAGSLDATESEVVRLTIEVTKVEKQLREADRERYLVDKQRFGIEDDIANLMSTKTTNEKAAKALLKDARGLIQRVHDVELQCADMENSIAGAKVEALNANAATASLKEILAGVEDELREKERLIERYEAEIRSRNDAIEKRMTHVDRLNRKFDKMMADAPVEENMGPLHAEIHNVQKAIAAKREEVEGMQKRWLVDQTALVASANDGESKTTRLRELQSQVVLLDQKRIRMDGAIASQVTEHRRLVATVKSMHEDMARINGLIARNAQLSARLAASTNAAASSFGEELKALERELSAAGL